MDPETPETPETPPEKTPEKTQENNPRELSVRLRELQAVPERLRSDAQWDEIIEIEINLQQGKFNQQQQQQGKAPGNSPKRQNPGPMRQSEHKPPSGHKTFRKGPMKSGRS